MMLFYKERLAPILFKARMALTAFCHRLRTTNLLSLDVSSLIIDFLLPRANHLCCRHSEALRRFLSHKMSRLTSKNVATFQAESLTPYP